LLLAVEILSGTGAGFEVGFCNLAQAPFPWFGLSLETKPVVRSSERVKIIFRFIYLMGFPGALFLVFSIKTRFSPSDRERKEQKQIFREKRA